MRKKIKRPLLEKSYSRFFKQLHNICQSNKSSPEDILNQSIINSWQGIFPLKQGGINATRINTGQRNNITARESYNKTACSGADAITAEYLAKKFGSTDANNDNTE